VGYTIYTMKESVAVAKEADAKKGVSPAKTDNSILRPQNVPEMQLGSLRGVIANIRRDGGTPSVESIAMQLSGMPTGERAPALLALQQTHGNRYVQRVVAGIQAKLKIGQPGDVYEQEADRVADVVMRMPESGVQQQPEEEEEREFIQSKPLAGQIPSLIQRQIEEEEEEEIPTKKHPSQTPSVITNEELRRQPQEEEEEKEELEITEEELESIEERMEEELERMEEEELRRLKREEEFIQTKQAGGQIPLVDSSLETKIRSLRGDGQPMPKSVRYLFEPRFGYDFGEVRLHTDSRAAECAREMKARAFTVGSNVVFGGEEYAPATTAGKRLLAHELTHVVQQGCGAGERIQRRERKQSGTAGGGSPSHPCSGSSRAATYTPTAQGVTVNLGPHDFGKTEKYGASCSFGACRVGGDWRFYINTLTVRIASAVQPFGYKTNVNAATDPVVTSSTYRDIMGDLRPNRRARATRTCGGNTFTDNISTYSLRNTYWKRQLVVDHEAYHRQDWDRIYRPELVSAEQQVWGHSIPTSAGSTSADAIQQANSALRSHISSAYQRACQAYAPQQETRAYGDGAPQYQQLVTDIGARAGREGW